jgi:two-component system, chemotaxis family, protein-glutamate methylesterase/glutaminase
VRFLWINEDVALKKIRVLVVDDSALVRRLLAEIINRQPDMECVGAAHDPLIAREMIRELNPDVLTLDVEMPRMDGLEFLARLMRLRPMPVVMISTLTAAGADVTLRALELGAVDFVAKPRMGLAEGFSELSRPIVERIRVAASAKIRRVTNSVTHVEIRPGAAIGPLGRVSTEKLVFIGASTGGTEAIKELLAFLPADAPAVAITQHMPPGFTASFAARLNSVCRITVKEAVHGERILPGHAYIAPGGRQFRVDRSGANYVAVVEDGPLVNRHRPSVEVLFKSGADIVGRNAFGIMLTGMGGDGADAMREMKDAGSYNYVQDEATCVVFGMPREAILRGAADEVLPIGDIAPALVARLAASSERFRV